MWRKLGEFDLIYESHESHLYCCECVKIWKPTPYEIEGLEGSKVVKDYGTLVKVYYAESMRYEVKIVILQRKDVILNIMVKDGICNVKIKKEMYVKNE